MSIEQSNNRCRGGPPATDPGPDQSLLLVMADHLDEPRTVLSVGFLHKALQVVSELPCGEKHAQYQHLLGRYRIENQSQILPLNYFLLLKYKRLISFLYAASQWFKFTVYELCGPSLTENTIKYTQDELNGQTCRIYINITVWNTDWAEGIGKLCSLGFSETATRIKKLNTGLNTSRPKEETTGKKNNLLQYDHRHRKGRKPHLLFDE